MSRGVLWKQGVLKSFAKLTRKYLYQSLRPATLLKRRLWHRCFSVNFAKFLRTPFFIEHIRWLLLNLISGPSLYPLFWSLTTAIKDVTHTEKNTLISSNFLAWKFCRKAQFPDNFEWIARNYGKTVPFHKIAAPGN